MLGYEVGRVVGVYIMSGLISSVRSSSSSLSTRPGGRNIAGDLTEVMLTSGV